MIFSIFTELKSNNLNLIIFSEQVVFKRCFTTLKKSLKLTLINSLVTNIRRYKYIDIKSEYNNDTIKFDDIFSAINHIHKHFGL